MWGEAWSRRSDPVEGIGSIPACDGKPVAPGHCQRLQGSIPRVRGGEPVSRHRPTYGPEGSLTASHRHCGCRATWRLAHQTTDATGLISFRRSVHAPVPGRDVVAALAVSGQGWRVQRHFVLLSLLKLRSSLPHSTAARSINTARLATAASPDRARRKTLPSACARGDGQAHAARRNQGTPAASWPDRC